MQNNKQAIKSNSNLITILKNMSNDNELVIEHYICKTILNNLEQFSDITLVSLAKKSFTSTASVIRFCKKIGFKGYVDFKFTLLQEYDNQVNNSSVIKDCICQKLELKENLLNVNVLVKQANLLENIYFFNSKISNINREQDLLNNLNSDDVMQKFNWLSEENYHNIDSQKSLFIFFTDILPKWFDQSRSNFLQINSNLLLSYPNIQKLLYFIFTNSKLN